MRIITTIFYILLLASCTNNYGDTNTNDDAINKTDIKNDNTVITKTNIENDSFLENISNPLIFNKINPSIAYDDSQDKIDIRYDNTAISINLFGEDESDLTLMMNGSVIDEGFNGNFNYTYEVDLQSAIKRIKVFTNDDNRQIFLLPATTEEYLTYNALLFDDSGFLHAYIFEIAEWDCGNIESIIANTKIDANAIQVIDNTSKNCNTRTYLFDGEYIKEAPKSFSYTDILRKYPKRFYKHYEFDVNADDIKDKIISSTNDDNNLFQNDELYVFLGDENNKYTLSLDTSNHTSDGGYFLSGILPRLNNSGFILRTYFSSRGYPINHYYYTYKNGSWYISDTTIEGYTEQDHDYYCTDNTMTTVSEYTQSISASFGNDEELLQNCPPLPIEYVVKTEQAEILNENFESRLPPNYYIKGDSIEAVSQNEDWVKVSYKNGTKFGWIDKRDLVPD